VNHLRDILRYRAAVDPTRTFLVYAESDEHAHSTTYGDFYDQVTALAGGLRGAGLEPGRRCAIHLPNSLEFVLAFWALQEAGAVAVPTITQYVAEELAYVVENSDAWGVITDNERLAKVTTVRSHRADLEVVVVGQAESGVRSLEELMHTETHDAPDDSELSAEALIIYTSGSTARPKGVRLTHRGSLFTAESYAQHFRLQQTDRILTFMPLFHVSGLFLQMLPVASTGATLILTPKFSLSRFWRWVRDFNITVVHMIAGPARLLLGATPTADDLHHTLRLMTLALPLASEDMVNFEARFGIKLCMVWGMTESSGGGTFMPPLLGHRPEYQVVGRQMLGWEVTAVDDEGADVGVGAPGELTIRSPGLMAGYVGDADSGASAIREGRLHTGDIGVIDDRGYVHFIDRKKDMLKPYGENVAASEVEATLLQHPAVAEAAVVGVPGHPLRGETIVAFVVGRPEQSVTPSDLVEHCATRLASFKIPSIIEVADELPKTSIGKVQKGELRHRAAALPEAEGT
jgi:carnitine-CoA ligase